MRYPPKHIDADNLNFSEFHPLDHAPFNHRCREFFPHGWQAGRHHLVLAWQFKWQGDICAQTLCRIGFHRPTTIFLMQEQVMHAGCRHCWKQLGPNQPMDQIE